MSVACVLLICVQLFYSFLYTCNVQFFKSLLYLSLHFCVMQTLGKLHFGSRYQVLLTVVLKLISSVQVVLHAPVKSCYAPFVDSGDFNKIVICLHRLA